MKKIFIGIPKSREMVSFKESFSSFYEKASEKYDIDCFETRGLERDEAREAIASVFLDSDADYLLFLDDDHTQHSVEMLDALIESDKEVCAIKCYSRWFPYQCTCMIIGEENNRYFEDVRVTGIHECYFVGFGMTLIKRRVFEVLSRPFFKCDDIGEKEDNYFCDRLKEHDIHPYACFDYTLPHNGIDETNVMELRKNNMAKYVAKQQKMKVIDNILNTKKDLTEEERKFLEKEKDDLDKTVI